MSGHGDQDQPSFHEAVKAYFNIGLLSFGGPAAQIALMHKVFVEDKKWLNEQHYLGGLSFCMLLPGPEAMQLATYVGWRLHGVIGGLAAGLLFVLPGAAVILCLALLYAFFGEMGWLQSAFLGIKATVLIVVIEALLRVSKKALAGKAHWGIAAFAFLSIFVFELPYPLIIVMAGLYGFFQINPRHDDGLKPLPLVSMAQTAQTIFLWLGLWFAPLMALGWATGGSFFYDLGMFFSKLATVTFGGAYAVLAYMSQQVVFDLGWLTTAQMMDGLGLAETTPGPLILVTEFVGFMAGFQEGGVMTGVMAAALVLWVTFAPCFLWIFAGAPYIEWITAQPRLKNTLSAITAAGVGVILSLSIWFGLHALFGDVQKETYGVVNLWRPDLYSVNMVVLLLTGFSFYLLIIRHINILYVLGLCSFLGALASLVV